MGLLTALNYVASFLLFVACILLIVTSVSASTVNYLSLLRVNLQGGDHVTLGSWGLCLRQSGPDACTNEHVGYNAGAYLNGLIGSNFGSGSRETIRVLTRAMVLHPIAAFFAFVAFAASAASSVCGAIMAMLFSLLTFVITVVALGCDFGWAALVHHRINENDFRGSRAEYRECIWFVLVAAILTLIASCLLFVSCCSGRNRHHDKEYAGTTRRRRFF